MIFFYSFYTVNELPNHIVPTKITKPNNVSNVQLFTCHVLHFQMRLMDWSEDTKLDLRQF